MYRNFSKNERDVIISIRTNTPLPTRGKHNRPLLCYEMATKKLEKHGFIQRLDHKSLSITDWKPVYIMMVKYTGQDKFQNSSLWDDLLAGMYMYNHHTYTIEYDPHYETWELNISTIAVTEDHEEYPIELRSYSYMEKSEAESDINWLQECFVATFEKE